jgi:hypothetical protein
MLPHKPAKTTAKSEPRDSGAGDHSAGDCQTVSLRFAIELGPGDTALGAYCAALRIDVNLRLASNG